LLKEIVITDEKSTQITRKIIEKLKQNAPASTEEEQLIHDNIAQIKKLFAELELINYYNIDSTEGGLTIRCIGTPHFACFAGY
jgi:DNA-binding protein H-NS